MKATTSLQHQSSIIHIDATAGKATNNPLQLKGKDNNRLAFQKEQNPLALSTQQQNPLQLVRENRTPLTGTYPLQAKENKTGLPDHIKAGVEALSGYSLDDVKVHYNSGKPSQLDALAYAQGTNIHVAPGQEKHLPHEAWHVVQQKQGRVKPAMLMKGEEPVNDDKGLEKEADIMGGKALTTLTQIPELSIQSIKTGNVIQQKGRIDLSKITGTGENAEREAEKRRDLEAKLKALKEAKRTQKTLTTANWIKKPDGILGEDHDKAYNTSIAAIREKYEKAVKELAVKELGENHPAYVSGNDYYGSQVGTDNLYKRPDNNKEYVRDMRGIFVPRYVRRELNQNDVPKVNNSEDLVSTGISTYSELEDKGKIHNLQGMSDADKNGPISWAHREFMQQSRGGGGNQFAFSHTSTKRPILSNDHLSFGTYDNGAILSDLSKIPKENIAAQWRINQVTGHKVMLNEDEHPVLGEASGFKERDSKVRMSGYRNMEILTQSVPNTAIVKKPGDEGWEGSDIEQAKAGDYNSRLDVLKSYNTRKEQLASQIKISNGKPKPTTAQKRQRAEINKEIEKLEEELKNTSYGVGTSARGALMEQKRRELEKT